MTRYLIRRILWAVVLFIAVTMVTYMIFFIIPADPARLALRRRRRDAREVPSQGQVPVRGQGRRVHRRHRRRHGLLLLLLLDKTYTRSPAGLMAIPPGPALTGTAAMTEFVAVSITDTVVPLRLLT